MPTSESEYWRVHEEEYRAIARTCHDATARRSWTLLADRCAARAAQTAGGEPERAVPYASETRHGLTLNSNIDAQRPQPLDA